MKIVFDNIIFSLQKSGGISGMWANLIQRFLAMDEIEPLFIEYPNCTQNIFRQRLDIPQELILKYTPRLSLQTERFLPVRLNIEEQYIFHSSYYRVSNDITARNLTTIHDFTYERLRPVNFISRKVHSLQKGVAISKSDANICVSNNTLRDLEYFHPNISSIKRVIGNAPICTVSTAKSTDSASGDYLLFVGSRASYKNFYKALEVASASRRKLIICGSPLSKQEIYHIKRFAPEATYDVVTMPDDKQLSGLYREAWCLLYPSDYEGFGIPVLEAQAHGCPVLCINNSSIAEVAGTEYPLLADSADINTLVSAIKKLDNPAFRKAVVDYGLLNCTRFSWDDIADKYKAVYSELLCAE